MNDACVCPGATWQDAVNILPPAGRLAQQTGCVMDSSRLLLNKALGPIWEQAFFSFFFYHFTHSCRYAFLFSERLAKGNVGLKTTSRLVHYGAPVHFVLHGDCTNIINDSGTLWDVQELW